MTQTVYGSVTHKASYFSYFFIVSSVPNTEGNYSDVTVSHYWQTSHTGYSFDTYSARPASITIEEETFNISQRFSVGTNWANGNPYLIQTASKRIYHESDGSKQITVSTRANGKASSYGPSASTDSADDCTAMAVITLDTIPRASSLTVTPSVVCDGENAVVITAKKAAPSFVHRATISVMGKTWTSEVFSDMTSYVLPKDWNNWILSASAVATVFLMTYATADSADPIGSSSATFEVLVPDTPEFYPTITSFNIVPINETPLVASWGICLQSYTKFQFSAVATVPYGAYVTKYSCVGFGTGLVTSEATDTTAVVQQPGTGTFLLTVTDSRNRTATVESEAFTVRPYTSPIISNPTVFRCDSGGAASANGTSAYLSAIAGYASCDGYNNVSLRCYYRPATVSTYGTQDFFNLTSGIGSVYGEGAFDASRDYVFKFVVSDSLGASAESTEFRIEAADVLLNATDNEHLAFFGFAENTQKGLTVFKSVHFKAGATGLLNKKTAVVTISLLGLEIPVYFIRSGNVTTMVIGYTLTYSADASVGSVLIPIPTGFEPCAEAMTLENTTTAFWGRGSYIPSLLGGFSLNYSVIRLYVDFLNLTPGPNWTLGATMTWINEE